MGGGMREKMCTTWSRECVDSILLDDDDDDTYSNLCCIFEQEGNCEKPL